MRDNVRNGDGDASQEVARGAIRAARDTVTAGRDAYLRDRHLPRVIAVGPDEISDRS